MCAKNSAIKPPMKKIVCLVGLLSSAPALSLDYGMCEANVSSKQYLNDVFSQAYPKTVQFKCLYDCMGSAGLQRIWGNSAVTIRNERDDAIKTVCQGAIVKRTSWGWDYAGAKPFYAHLAETEQVKDFARNWVDRDNAIERALLVQLKSKAFEVAQMYFKVGAREEFRYYQEAGVAMYQVVAGLPDDTQELDQLIETIAWEGKLPDMDTSQGLLHSFIKSEAKFRF